MAQNQGNGRNVAVPDENRPSWRPEDENGQRNRRSIDDDDRYMSRDRDDERYGRHWEDRSMRWDRDEGRGTERYGQGQSGYGAGRYGEDRSYGSRNQAWRGEDRPWDRGPDERFSRGRGGYGHGGYQESGGYLGQGGQEMGWSDEEDWGNEGYMGQRGRGTYRGNTNESFFRGGRQGQQGMQGFQGQRRYGRDQGMYGGPGQQQGGMYGHGPGAWGETEENAPEQWRPESQYGRGAYGQGAPGSQGHAMYGESFQRGSGYAMQRGGYGGMRGPHRGKGPMGYTRSDERIKEMVCEALTEDHNIDASNIDVSVKNGEVVLSGTVDDRMQKRMAEDCVEQLSGIKDIQNQIRVTTERKTESQPGQIGQPMGQDKKHRA